MDQKRRVLFVHCILFALTLICMITIISLIVERRFVSSVSKTSYHSIIYNNKSLSDIDYNMNHYSSNVDDIPESGWNMNDDVFRFSTNGMYLGKNDENYLIIEDENVSQIDYDKRAKVKEVILYERHICMRI